MGVRWEGGSRGKGSIHTDCWFTLLYSRNECNIVKQLYSNKKENKISKKKQQPQNPPPIWWFKFSSSLVYLMLLFLKIFGGTQCHRDLSSLIRVGTHIPSPGPPVTSPAVYFLAFCIHWEKDGKSVSLLFSFNFTFLKKFLLWNNMHKKRA